MTKSLVSAPSAPVSASAVSAPLPWNAPAARSADAFAPKGYIYAVFSSKSEFYPIGLLFYNKWDFCDAVMDSDTTDVSGILRFDAPEGDDDDEKREFLRDLAIEWSNADRAAVALTDECLIGDYFRYWAGRFGLLEEFTENMVC